MKKLFLLLALVGLALTVNAQTKVTLSTYKGTQIDKYVGKQCDVNMNRHLFTGWNTLEMPFAMSEQELEAVVGEDFKLERLVGVNQQGDVIELLFQDCKAEGVKAGMPYLLYYTGETGNKKFTATGELVNSEARVSFNTQNGVQVTMGGAKLKTQGQGKYGILVVNNSEANFTYINNDNVFYATRCYVEMSDNQPYTLVTRHLGANELTSISEIAATDDVVDVFNIQGMRVAKGIRVSDIYSLEPGLYLIKGRKVLVR